jgi:hypothetical protein
MRSHVIPAIGFNLDRLSKRQNETALPPEHVEAGVGLEILKLQAPSGCCLTHSG